MRIPILVQSKNDLKNREPNFKDIALKVDHLGSLLIDNIAFHLF